MPVKHALSQYLTKLNQYRLTYPKSSLAVLAFLILWAIWLSQSGEPENQPLYWVAPMDSNYRRDEPGLSPMGMELVPVYQEDLGADQHGPGTITVSAAVQNQIGVRLTMVQQGQLDTAIHTFGRIQFKESSATRLYATVPGYLDMVFIDEVGELVRSGQSLYALYSRDLIRAQEEVLQAQTPQGQTSAEDTLRVMGVPEVAINTLHRDGTPQQSIVFQSPHHGVITQLPKEEGSQVQPGDTLMTVQATDQVWAELDVFERDVQDIKTGLPVEISTSHSLGAHSDEQQWSGTIDELAPTINSTTQTLRVRVNLNNPEGLLRPGTLIRGKIQLAPSAPALLIPSQAVIHLNQQDRVVLALGDGFFKSINVRLGQTNGEYTEVLEGLDLGDMIVTSAHFLMDSESSKTSDFQRMDKATSAIREAWVNAVIKGISVEERILQLAHDPIDAWGMPAMTMKFQAADTIDLASLTEGQNIQVYVVDKPDEPLFLLTELKTGAGHD